MNDVTVMHWQLKYDIYILSYLISVIYTSNKYPRIDNVIDAYLWHCKLSYINKNRINKLAKKKIFNINDCESLSIDEFCLLKKLTQSSFTGKDEQASNVLGLVHTDVYGPMNIVVREKYYYFIIFTNDLSRYWYVYLIKYKSESFEIFKRFCNEVEK